MNNSPLWVPPLLQVKFNQALADNSMTEKPRLIDGIVLTKFDTIDDKVPDRVSAKGTPHGVAFFFLHFSFFK